MTSARQHLRAGRIVILGGGPCGLACANELDRLGHHHWTLLEAGSAVGGLASSVIDRAGFTWDLGGHVVFSHFGEFDQLLDELFAPHELLHHDRSSYIRFRDRWVPYPFQHHLHCLPQADAEACLQSLTHACQRREETLPTNADFATWLQDQYGSGLVERFFAPYNTKVWATSPEKMSANWVAERVAPVDLDEILAAFYGAKAPAPRWGPNSTFAFPSQGGTGEIWRRLGHRLGARVRTHAAAKAVNPTDRLVQLENGETVPYDQLVATMPLDQLVAMTTTTPSDVREAAGQLQHTTVAMVGLGYGAPTLDERSWFYFPEDDVPFYRATNFSKYAPANVPAADTTAFSSWMTETSVMPGTWVNPTALVKASDAALRRHRLVPGLAELVTSHVEMISYAYPIPTLGRDEALAVTVPWLEERAIYPRGRFGTWRYEIGNMDHAVKMGIDVARRLVTGATEELLSSTDNAVLAGSRS
ncbi:protoporphyrinogen/coproporphyrinogen oxidase [Streptomyces lydicus]|uniref:protoporphyrinogen/coproporphyrinogen oxidase n=1 Tax=Streptomyces lydicus TaxID=47763 RepID=UPI003330B0D4